MNVRGMRPAEVVADTGFFLLRFDLQTGVHINLAV